MFPTHVYFTNIAMALEPADMFCLEACSHCYRILSLTQPCFVWKSIYEHCFSYGLPVTPTIQWDPQVTWRLRCLGRLALPRALRILPYHGALGLYLGAAPPPFGNTLQRLEHGGILRLCEVPVHVSVGTQSLSCTLGLRVADWDFALWNPGKYDVMLDLDYDLEEGLITTLTVATSFVALDYVSAPMLRVGCSVEELLRVAGLRDEMVDRRNYGGGHRSYMFRLSRSVPAVLYFTAKMDGEDGFYDDTLCSITIGTEARIREHTSGIGEEDDWEALRRLYAE